jgi:rRNA pseudouridine-1189 N-methylase Emg1 (Nep1/Mra1 family)
MKIKDYDGPNHQQEKEIEYLKQLRDSVGMGLDGVERKLENFIQNIKAIEQTLRNVVEMAGEAIEEAENSKRKTIPKNYKEYIYLMLHTCSTELSKIKQPLKLPRLESDILKDLIGNNELLADMIFDKEGARGIQKFGNINKDNEEGQNNGGNN